MLPRLLTRRHFFRHAAQTSAAVLAGATTLSSAYHAKGDAKADADAIQVGILHSVTGFMARSETALKEAELLAIEELNRAGGVLGRKIQPVVEDPASDFLEGFPEKAKKLLLQDKVACVFGCWTSISRKTVLPLFEQANGLLFYPLTYEGQECSKNVVYSGAVPNQHVLPAVDYLGRERKKRKFYLLGSDYIWPRTAARIVKAHLKDKHKVELVGEKYVSLVHREFKDVVDDIKSKQPDAILNLINGDSNIAFFKELASANIKADELPVCSFLIDEVDLRELEPAWVTGHLAAASYFQKIDTAENQAFVKTFQKRYGAERVCSDPVAAAYSQVYLWKHAVEKAKSIDVDKVREALRNLEIKSPAGMLKVDGKNLHTWKPFRIGGIRDDRQFDIVYQAKEPIRPEPYPQVGFPGWDCDWSRGGVIKP
jgi:urea transport system substrate-binding protein